MHVAPSNLNNNSNSREVSTTKKVQVGGDRPAKIIP